MTGSSRPAVIITEKGCWGQTSKAGWGRTSERVTQPSPGYNKPLGRMYTRNVSNLDRKRMKNASLNPAVALTCVTLDHKTSRWGIFVAIAKNTLYESKLSIFLLDKNH